MIVLEKLNLKKPISVIYFDGNKQSHFVKRFVTEDIPEGKYSFIGEHKDSILEVVSTDWRPIAEVVFVKQKGKDRKKEKINLEEFISVKGWKSLGNKLSNKKVKEIKWLDSLPYEEVSESNDTIPIKDEHNEPLIIKDVEVGEITLTEE